MTPHVLLVLALLFAALVLLAADVVAMEVVALGIVVVLAAAGVLSLEEAVLGFGSETLVMLGGIFVMSGGLVHAGLLERIGLVLRRRTLRRPHAIQGAFLTVVASLSAWMSNTATVALFVPLAAQLSRRGGLPPARLYMPLAFASLLGGACTLVGTSTNVVVSGELKRLGQAPLSLFETGRVGLPVAVVGLAYLLLVAPRILDRIGRAGKPDAYEMRSYLGEVIVDEGSTWAGKSLRDLHARDHGIEVVGIVHGPGGSLSVPRADDVLQPGALVVLKGTSRDILDLTRRAQVRTVAEAGQGPLEKLTTAEVLVAPGSRLAGRTLKQAQFRQRFDAVALAIYRHGHVLHDKVGRIELKAGDLLLIQGSPEAVERLHGSDDLLVLDDHGHRPAHPRRAWVAVATFLAFLVAAAATGEIALCALAGAVVMVAAGCLTVAEAHQAAQWRLLVLVGGMMALAVSMTSTGAASFLADRALDMIGDAGPRGLLAVFFALTVLLTQPLSNQAAALVMLPVALAAAERTGLPLRQLALTVTIAASCSFVTPLEPACALVFGPGRYRFRDFLVVGLPLTLLVMAVTVALVPVLWG